MKVFFLLLLTCFSAKRCWTQNLSVKDEQRNGIFFESDQKFGLILISARVNGRPATLVMDTGSSRTILSPELLEVRPQALKSAGPIAKGSGFVGFAGRTTATVELGAFKYCNQNVLVMDDLGEISKSVNKRVDGILGEDILHEVNSIEIDFKHHRLVLRR